MRLVPSIALALLAVSCTSAAPEQRAARFSEQEGAGSAEITLSSQGILNLCRSGQSMDVRRVSATNLLITGGKACEPGVEGDVVMNTSTCKSLKPYDKTKIFLCINEPGSDAA